MTGPVLQIVDLVAGYGAARIVDGISFDVGQGEVVALLGRNGAGKSTSIKALMGLIARSGSVRFLGEEIGHLATHQIARRGLGYVPEDRRIFTDLTVRENLDIGRQAPRGAATVKEAIWDEARVFALFPQLGAMANRRGGEMSGGEQQMLTVARTLMGNPQMILLDEPSEGVAPIIVEQMADAVVRMRAAGVAILLAEQNPHFAALVSRRAIVLEKGEIRWQGAMQALTTDEALQRHYLTV